MGDYYILVGKSVVKCDDIHAWSRFFHVRANRVLKQEYIGDVFVSTVFLGIDHGWGRSDEPIVFETMAFDAHGLEIDGLTTRSTSWNLAMLNHYQTCLEVLTPMNPWRFVFGRFTVWPRRVVARMRWRLASSWERCCAFATRMKATVKSWVSTSSN